MVNDEPELRDAEIGKIEILRKFSFFEVEQSFDKKLQELLTGRVFDDVTLTAEIALPKIEGEDNQRRGERRSDDRFPKERKNYTSNDGAPKERREYKRSDAPKERREYKRNDSTSSYKRKDSFSKENRTDRRGERSYKKRER